MKAVLIFAIFACFLAFIDAQTAEQACAYNGGNGEPVCNEANVKIRTFRDNNDPNHYWDCNEVGAPAVHVLCEQSAYSEEEKTCVSWDSWTWTQPCDPPSPVVEA